MKRSFLDKLSVRGYGGLYIYDEISEGVAVKEMLSNELRMKAMNSLKTLNLDACRAVANSLVDELLNQSDISIDMVNVAAFDNYIYVHCINVAVLSVIVGIGAGLNVANLRQLSQAALLHDIGKLSISLDILNKKDKLTDEEMRIIRCHPEEGYNIVKNNIRISALVKNAILSHHENEDGSGYPRCLKSEKIHHYAKIIHVCDVYDALVSNRAYRRAMNPAEALEYLMGNCWIMFDVEYVKKLMEYVSPYPTGITVELSNGKQALVIRQNNEHRVRPVVVVIDTKEEIDLMKVLDLTIIKILT
ncbi:MAG: HD-GYP domain-containing protein [Peptococcaceae bacterium]|nr:HD-GYP domain-containing protein [Peptococcaceae bacterium]